MATNVIVVQIPQGANGVVPVTATNANAYAPVVVAAPQAPPPPPQAPGMMPAPVRESQCVADVAVEVPSTRDVYFFNARVRNARDGVFTAICDVFMIDDDGNDALIASLAPGQKFTRANARVNAQFVAQCRDTREEITRGTVSGRRGYNKVKRTRSGKEYVKTKWIDPVEQRVVLGEWTDCRRCLNPTRLDYDMSHWDEPEDDPETGKPVTSFKERFYYYLVTRHQLLTCFFVSAGDSFSRFSRFADLTNTLLWTWGLTVILSETNTAARIITVALLMAPLSAIFKIACRIRCCGVGWGHIVSIPIWLCGLIVAIVIPIEAEGDAIERSAYSFFSSLALEWLFKRPVGIAVRVWLYEKGWNKWIGIGPKSKWWFDKTVSLAGG